MGIMLGDLTVEQIEERIGFKFPDEIRAFMKDNHQAIAQNIKKGKWHCFEMPFNLVCGDIDTAKKIYISVKERSPEVKKRLRISIQR